MKKFITHWTFAFITLVVLTYIGLQEPYVKEILKLKSFDILFTTLSRGVSVGTELQYIDGNTLGRSLATRQEFTI